MSRFGILAVFLILFHSANVFAQQKVMSDDESEFDVGCKTLQKAVDLEKSGDFENAWISYHVAAGCFEEVTHIDPVYRPQEVTRYKELITVAEARVESHLSQANKRSEGGMQTLHGELVSEVITLLVTLAIAALAIRHYKKTFYPPSETYETFWPRFLVAFVDGCILWPLATAVTMLEAASLPFAYVAFFLIVQILTTFSYTVVMHAKYGQTLGKMACKVKVVDGKTGGAITLGQALAREGVPYLFSCGGLYAEIYTHTYGRDFAWSMTHRLLPFLLGIALPMTWLLAEIVVLFANEKRRALHDFIAGTVTVRLNIDESLPVTTEPNQVPGMDWEY